MPSTMTESWSISISSSSEVGTTSFVTMRAFSFSLNEKVGFGDGGLGTNLFSGLGVDLRVVRLLVWDGEVMEAVRLIEAFAVLADMIWDARSNALDVDAVGALGRVGTLGVVIELLDLITGADNTDFLTDRESFGREILGAAT